MYEKIRQQLIDYAYMHGYLSTVFIRRKFKLTIPAALEVQKQFYVEFPYESAK